MNPAKELKKLAFELKAVNVADMRKDYFAMANIILDLINSKQGVKDFVLSQGDPKIYNDDERAIEFTAGPKGVSFEYNADLDEFIHPMLERFCQANELEFKRQFERPMNTAYGAITK